MKDASLSYAKWRLSLSAKCECDPETGSAPCLDCAERDMCDQFVRLREAGSIADKYARLQLAIWPGLPKFEPTPECPQQDFFEAVAEGLRADQLAAVAKLAAIRAKLQDIVCTEDPDKGVVLLSDQGPTHREYTTPSGPSYVNVYDHEHFSPLGDALIELWEMSYNMRERAHSI